MSKSMTVIGEPKGLWPRSLACIKRADNKLVADAIWGLDEVVAWINVADDDESRDGRACSLTTAIANALRNSGDKSNSQLSWETPAAHRNRYVRLARRLDVAQTYQPGSKRLIKLRRDLGKDKAAVFIRSAEATPKDLAALSEAAREFACAADDPNWTQPRPNHDGAARNTFICELVQFLRDNEAIFGVLDHVMASAIVSAFFENGASPQDVERLARQRKKPPSR